MSFENRAGFLLRAAVWRCCSGGPIPRMLDGSAGVTTPRFFPLSLKSLTGLETTNHCIQIVDRRIEIVDCGTACEVAAASDAPRSPGRVDGVV